MPPPGKKAKVSSTDSENDAGNTALAAGAVDMSKEEAKIFDRQIRVWGKDAQQQIRKAKVLIVGMNATNAELAKNLVLTGVGTVTVCDGEVVKSADMGANFLLPPDSVGKRRASVAVEALRELNPMVILSGLDKPVAKISSTDLGEHSILCAADLNSEDELRLDKLCRVAGVAFLSSRTFGFSGTLFVDLGDAFGFKTEAKKDVHGKEVPGVAEELSYATLEDVYDVPWGKLPRPKKLSKLWLYSNALSRCQRGGRDVKTITETDFNTLVENMEFPSNMVSFEAFDELRRTMGVEMSSVCAVLGGIIGQEVIKIVSRVGKPIQNFFCYDARTAKGVVVKVGKQG